jgi:hypothetical protein
LELNSSFVFIVEKNESYTYVGPSSSTSNLDHVVSSFPIKQATVLREGYYSEAISKAKPLLSRGFAYLVQNAGLILVSTRSIYSLRVILQKSTVHFDAEKCAVPSRRVRKRTEVTNWSKNQSLFAACHSAKLWLRIWNESEKPCSGMMNDLCLKTKRKFTRALKDHKIMLIQKNIDKIASDPSLLCKSFKRSDRNSFSSIPKKAVLIVIKVSFRHLTFLQKVNMKKSLTFCLLILFVLLL